ncbi:hypothetical protein DFO73_12031 [Cytobacillus oceanisediminis]|uniref:Uncharacterized protein n=1 Tax=Cytobacillus oceanisediminis TaxID=665099 RepID=A0A2V2ZIH9_9BACI|nr:hypothetical protein DFO73_12031 [Cytobacillus oceanisediminis]
MNIQELIRSRLRVFFFRLWTALSVFISFCEGSAFSCAELLLLCPGFFCLEQGLTSITPSCLYFPVNSTICLSISFIILPLTRHKGKKRSPSKGPFSYCESIGLYNLTSGFFSWNHLSAKSFSNRKTFLS